MYKHLTVEQRQLALRLHAKGLSLREVGPQVGCSFQTVARIARRGSRRPVRLDGWVPGPGRLTLADWEEIARNPCRVRGAGTERAPERPVLTVAQVVELAELVGRRPIGNIRRLPDGQYRLRYRRHGNLRTAPEIYSIRPTAEAALWAMGSDGRADRDHDQRYRTLVPLATFASLRWGEATALRRCDLDLAAGIVRVRAAYAERSTGELVLGPPKSRAARRIVSIPPSIVPALRDHLALFVSAEADALIFSFRVQRAARCGAATSTRCRPGRTPSGRSAPKVCTFMTSGIPGTTSPRLAARALRI